MGALKALRYYKKVDGTVPVWDWLKGLGSSVDRGRILRRLERVAEGNLGDHKALGGGINELRCFFGPGYRVYYGVDSETYIVLLIAGDKSTQSTDIFRATSYWQDYLIRKGFA